MIDMKFTRITLAVLQLFIALGAIPAGIGYLSDVSGTGMGTSPELLKNSPLDTFLIPALILLIIHGFGNLLGAILCFRKSRLAGFLAMILGAILVVWIIFQVYWISLSSFMQPLFFGIGILEFLLGYVLNKKIKNQKA